MRSQPGMPSMLLPIALSLSKDASLISVVIVLPSLCVHIWRKNSTNRGLAAPFYLPTIRQL